MTKKHLYKFFINLLIFFFILISLDRIVGAVLKHYYFKQTSGLNYRTTYAIDSTKADILVFGSSRANHHYVPEVFEDSLKMSFYNTGRDGNFLLYNYAIFKAILKRHTPKIIIMDLNIDDIYYNENSYSRLSSLLPYYENHPEIRNIIEMRSPYEKFKLLSKMYPFNSIILTIAVGNLEVNKFRKSDRKGYIPLYSQLKNKTLIDLKQMDIEIDTFKLILIKEIAISCKIRNIRLYFTRSPAYVKKEQLKVNILEEISKNLQCSFIDFYNDTLFCEKPIFFYDNLHLNSVGAEVFLKIIGTYY